MSELLDPKNDFLFKRIFGSEKNKDVLLTFLNHIFKEANKPSLSEILLLNPYTDKDSPLDKQSIFDIHARTEEGELINVEMQLFNKYDTEKRTLFYWSKQYSNQLLEGNAYRTLQKCVTINVLNYSLLPNDQYHNVFHLREDRTHISLLDDIEIHFLELPKLEQMTTPLEGSPLINWLLFLKGTDPSHWEVLSMNEPELKKAMTTLEFLSQDREARMRYEARQKFLHDEASLVDSAMAEGERRGVEAGFQKGIEQGIEQGKYQAQLDMARNMFSLGLDIEVIAKATGLSQEDIRSLS